MSWTTTKTWAFKETLSSADMNTYVRDNMNASDAHPNGIYVNAVDATVRIGNYGNNNYLVFNNAAGNESTKLYENGSDNFVIELGGSGNQIRLHDSGGTLRAQLNTTNNYWAAMAGYGIRAYDSTNAFYAAMRHDGTNVIINASSGEIEMQDNVNFGVNGVMRLSEDSARGRLTLYASAAKTKELHVFNANGYGVIGMKSNESFRLKANNLEMVHLETSGHFRIYDTGITKYTEIYHNGTYSVIQSSSGGMYVTTSTDGHVVVIGRHPRRSGDGKLNSTTTSGTNTYINSHIQSGWGWARHTGVSGNTVSVSFPVSFSSSNVRVVAMALGHNNSTSVVPTSEASFTQHTDGGNSLDAVIVDNITASGFTISVFHTDNATILSTYHGFSWIAIGPV